MNEKGKNRKEWVKTVAIIFLSVLLVLTFFSNTIMNYSLPEVATQYVESGTITAKVRGSGVVESGDPYSVKLKTTSSQTVSGTYEVESVEVKVGDKVQKGDVLCHLTAGESKALKDAQDALDKQILNYEIQILQGDATNDVLSHAKSGSTTPMSTYQAQVLAKEDEIKRLEKELEDAQETLNAWTKQQGVAVTADDEKEELEKAEEALEEAQAVIDLYGTQIADLESRISELENYIQVRKTGWESAQDGLIEFTEDGKVKKMSLLGGGTVSGGDADAVAAELDNWREEINTKEALVESIKASDGYVSAVQKLEEAKKAVKEAQEDYDEALSNTKDNVSDKVEAWTKEVTKRQKKLDEARTEKSKLISDIVNELNWGETLSALRENVEKLKLEDVGSEVTAPISGDIISVNVKSGRETPSDNILFTIQPEGKGYTMQMSVTNEQAKRLSVGDRADLVNSWRYDNVDVMLSSIKPDPQNPSQSKMLTFDISGDVVAGQSLSISIGQKSANYDLTVPNSAIREDNNGKFILTVTTKSTPLSNRYIATRVDVEVLASDDTRSAINAALYGYEYVITTSTAPVEPSKQIRLANNN
ncbi:MAG: HlyD family efflux transporter periplasmic adaptor subunit [Lachnospiraceae bacterium]|nr:HlyD family efflux transporter periplasmic adaptor subunit [Lachnospiraceae bacterium]